MLTSYAQKHTEGPVGCYVKLNVDQPHNLYNTLHWRNQLNTPSLVQGQPEAAINLP